MIAVPSGTFGGRRSTLSPQSVVAQKNDVRHIDPSVLRNWHGHAHAVRRDPNRWQAAKRRGSNFTVTIQRAAAMYVRQPFVPMIFGGSDSWVLVQSRE